MKSSRKGEKTPYIEFRWEDIPPGACRIMRLGDKKIAICKDERDDKIRLYEVVEE